MTFHCRVALPLFVAALLLVGAAQAAAEPVLILDQSSGVAVVQRNGTRLTLNPEDALQEQDQIITDRNGRMKLNLARHGFVEVGPNAAVRVQRLPLDLVARDLQTIFSIGKGYFHVVWKHPEDSTHWPLLVTMAGHYISLSSGEYFFSNTGGMQRACVAAGQMEVQPAGSTYAETIKPPVCVHFAANTTPQVIARTPDDWIAMRRDYDIDASSATLPAADGVPARASAPAKTPTKAPAKASAKASAKVPLITAVAPAVPKAAASKKSPAAATGKVATGGDWTLNIASYSDTNAAKQTVARLRRAGYQASIQPVVVNGRGWFRVQLRGFPDQLAAHKAAQELQSTLGLQNIWVLKP